MRDSGKQRRGKKPERGREAGTGPPTAAAPGGELIWGIHPVGELLRQRPAMIHTLYLAPGRRDAAVQELAAIAAAGQVRVEEDLPAELGREVRHQGVAARGSPPPLWNSCWPNPPAPSRRFC